METKIIALYLPQYHPTPENDKWWGVGFTEWTNVAKAKPLFRGHDQPKIPADLGFYDLRLSENREKQADLAKEAGVYGFCYWHYWFGEGKQLLDRPFREVLDSGTPDFPFCLAWANHSWYAKSWNPQVPDKLLIEQKYLGEEDNKRHFNLLLRAFKDERYIKIDNKPVFVVFKPLRLEGARVFIAQWNSLARENGFDGIYFIGQGVQSEFDEILGLGFNAVNHEEVNGIHAKQSKMVRLLKQFKRSVFKTPRCYDYSKAMRKMIVKEDYNENIFPTICPNFDHTPRSGTRGLVYTNSNPRTFREHVQTILSLVSKKKNKIVFLKSWNEWGEGNYMEPDLKYGKAYINVLREELEKQEKDV
jgi:hypothetical protein